MLRRNSADRSRCSICLPNIYSSVTFSTSTRWVFILELSIDESSELSSRRLRFTSDEHVSDSVVSSSTATSSVGWIKNDKNISSFSPLCVYNEYTHSYYGTLPHYAHLEAQLIWMTINYGFCCETETQSHLHIATIFIQTAFYMSDVLPAAHPTVSISKHSRYTIEQWQEVTHNPLNGVIVEDLEWNFKKVCTLDIAPLRESSPQKHSGMAHVLKGSHILPAHPCIYPQWEWAIPAFAFAAIAGTHLPTPDGWKAELAWVAGYIVRQFTCLKAVTHPTTNRAQCRATALIETNALPLH